MQSLSEDLHLIFLGKVNSKSQRPKRTEKEPRDLGPECLRKETLKIRAERRPNVQKMHKIMAPLGL